MTKEAATTKNAARDRGQRQCHATTPVYVEAFHGDAKCVRTRDWLVVDAVLRNWSPRPEFPANGENNWEYFDFWLFRPKLPIETCAFSVPYEEVP